MPSIVESKSIQ